MEAPFGIGQTSATLFGVEKATASVSNRDLNVSDDALLSVQIGFAMGREVRLGILVAGAAMEKIPQASIGFGAGSDYT